MGTYADDWRKFIRIVYQIVCMMKALLEREFPYLGRKNK
jgi:hypothetical protein